AATLTVVDELTRALPAITDACTTLTSREQAQLLDSLDNHYLLKKAMDEITARLSHALD
ncbi:MAG: phosphopantothenate/pantothenate synthetase family protein, partial [Methanoregula sp.]